MSKRAASEGKKVDRKILIENGVIYTRFTSYGVLNREAIKKAISNVLAKRPANAPINKAYSASKQKYRFNIYVENYKVAGYNTGTPRNLDSMKEMKLIDEPSTKEVREEVKKENEVRKVEVKHVEMEIYDQIAKEIADFAEMKFRSMWSVKGYAAQWTNAYKRVDMIQHYSDFFKRYGPPVVKVGVDPQRVRHDNPVDDDDEPEFENDESGGDNSDKGKNPSEVTSEPEVMSWAEYQKQQAEEREKKKKEEEEYLARPKDKSGRIILMHRHEPGFVKEPNLYVLSSKDDKARVKYERDTGLRLDDANSILETRVGMGGNTIFTRKYNEKLGPRDYKLKPVV